MTYFYERIKHFDPKDYQIIWDKLINPDYSSESHDPWVSNQPGNDAGRYAPSEGNNQEEIQNIESQQSYKDATDRILNPDGTPTEYGEKWMKETDALLPEDSPARFYDKDGNLRQSWSVGNNDTYGRPPQQYNNLRDYVNHVRNDQIKGARHNNLQGRGTRWYYIDKTDGSKHYVSPDEAKLYQSKKVGESFEDGVTWEDYELVGPLTADINSAYQNQQDLKLQQKPLPDLAKKKSDINPTFVDNTKSGFWGQLSNLAEKVRPDLLGASRLLTSLRTNNKIARTLKEGLKPTLLNTYELYSPVTGAYSEMQLRNRQAANVRRQAAKPFTSDASLQLAGELDANRQATDLEYQGFLADDKEIKRTAAEALKRQEDNIARRTDVANKNRASINDVIQKKSEIEAQRLNANWQGVDNFLKGIETRWRSDLDEKKTLKQNMLEQNISDRYSAAISRLDEKYKGSNPSNYIYRAQDPNYVNAVKNINRWATNQIYGVLNGTYTPTSTSYIEDIDTYISNIKFKQGGRLVRKMANGSFFTLYTPVDTPTSTSSSTSNSKKKSSSSNDSNSQKYKITTKDLVKMIGDKSGLPNELIGITRDLSATLALQNLTGIETTDLAQQYLYSNYKMQIMAQNKSNYDKAIEKATASGALAEPAINSAGQIAVQNKETKGVEYVFVNDFIEDQDKYNILTVQALAQLRAYDPNLAFDQQSIDAINNSIGFEEFQSLLDKAQINLGSTQYSEKGIRAKDALLGLQFMSQLSDDEKKKYLEWADDGTYSYDTKTNSNVQQINALVDYMCTVLPTRAKTWASIKTGITNKEEATKQLVKQYLAGKQNITREYSVTPPSSGSSSKSKKGSNGGNGETVQEELGKVKEGFWAQLQSQKGGDDYTYDLLTGQGHMFITGKYYGTTPGMDRDKSLQAYIADSNLGYLIKNSTKITLGDVPISTNSFNEVMIKSSTGALAVSLPIKADGTVNFDVISKYETICRNLRDQGLQPGSQEYDEELGKMLQEEGLDTLVDSNGLPNKNRFGFFLVLEGVASNRAKGRIRNPQSGAMDEVRFEDFDSDYIVNMGDGEDVYRQLENGLSTKDNKYESDYNEYWFTDDVFGGNIYIPLNVNRLNAINADENEVTSQQSKLYERLNQAASTNSDEL